MKGIKIIVLGGMLIILFVILLFMPSKKPVDLQTVKEIINRKYPVIKSNITFEEPCRSCESSSCPEECWVVRIDAGGNVSKKLKIIVDPVSGEIREEDVEPCKEWWCNANECVYYHTEGDAVYYNTGCENPEPVCDPEYQKCRKCTKPEECLSLKITNETLYEYTVSGTSGHAIFNATDSLCKIYQGGDMLFKNVTSLEDCKNALLFYTKCTSDGNCAFVPVFGLIPY